VNERALVLELRVQPRSSREGIDGYVAGRIRVRVNAAPVDNAANRRVLELLAKAFGVPRSRVELISGASGRDKRVRIHDPRRRPDWLVP
jgi:uncharacterized protein (TIGR00251 family)